MSIINASYVERWILASKSTRYYTTWFIIEVDTKSYRKYFVVRVCDFPSLQFNSRWMNRSTLPHNFDELFGNSLLREAIKWLNHNRLYLIYCQLHTVICCHYFIGYISTIPQAPNCKYSSPTCKLLYECNCIHFIILCWSFWHKRYRKSLVQYILSLFRNQNFIASLSWSMFANVRKKHITSHHNW